MNSCRRLREPRVLPSQLELFSWTPSLCTHPLNRFRPVIEFALELSGSAWRAPTCSLPPFSFRGRSAPPPVTFTMVAANWLEKSLHRRCVPRVATKSCSKTKTSTRSSWPCRTTGTCRLWLTLWEQVRMCTAKSRCPTALRMA